MSAPEQEPSPPLPFADPWPQIAALKTLLCGIKKDFDALNNAFVAMRSLWSDARAERDLARDAYAYRAKQYEAVLSKLTQKESTHAD